MAKKVEDTSAVALPARAHSRAGVEFCPQDDTWRLRDAVATRRFDFSSLPGAAPEIIPALKGVLAWYLENQSLCHSAAMFNHFKAFFSTMKESGQTVAQISAVDIVNYRSALGKERAWYLASLGGAIKKWHRLGYPGVDSTAVKLLDKMRRKGNQKGAAVLTMDPEKGPFTDIELQAIQAALRLAYAGGRIDREEYLLGWLFMLLGPRPGQLSALKVDDLDVQPEGDSRTYTLRIPRQKQRGQPHRSEFKSRPISSEIGHVLYEHAKSVRSWAGEYGLPPGHAPMFPASRAPGVMVPGFEWHRTANDIGGILKNVLCGLDVISERTGGPIKFTSYRFRYTLGTRAAAEGYGELIIADLLDHSDTQNVGVYVEATPAIIERLDKALALQMAPLAQAFAGVLDDGGKAHAANAIVDPRFNAERPVGGCGTYGFCGFAAPIACYTCVHFHPWLDGPHEAVLDHLVAERERLAERGDMRIASVNDRTILAVAEVVRQCRELRGAPEEREVRGG